MCAVLDLLKSTYYYHNADSSGKRTQKAEDTTISKKITRIFKESRNNYGTCKSRKN
jgi:putative transposase